MINSKKEKTNGGNHDPCGNVVPAGGESSAERGNAERTKRGNAERKNRGDAVQLKWFL